MLVEKLKLYLLIGLLIVSPSTVFAQACETTIDGNCRLDVDIVDYEGVSAPSVSPFGKGRRYFDATTNVFRCSENGAAFVDCDGDTTGGNPGGAVTQVQFHGAGGVFAGDADFTFDGLNVVVGGSVTSNAPGDSRLGIGGTKHGGLIITNTAEVITTDATQTVLDTIPLSDEKSYIIFSFISAMKNDGLLENGRIIIGAFRRTGGGSAIQDGDTITLFDQPAASGLTIVHTVASNNARISVTGKVAETWSWSATSLYINSSK